MLHGEENMGLGHVSGAKSEAGVRIIRPSLFVPSNPRFSGVAPDRSIEHCDGNDDIMQPTMMTGSEEGTNAAFDCMRKRAFASCLQNLVLRLLLHLASLYFDYSTLVAPEKFTASFPFYGSRNMRGMLCYFLQGASICDVRTE